MATAARRAKGHRFRAPPPTPVATGKGSRSAAVDDWVLSEYLDRSLKVPNLTLPESCFPMRSPVKDPPEVDLPALLGGEESAVRRVLAAVVEIGAFRIGGRDKVAAAEEVRAAIEAGGAVFGVPGELGRCLGRRDGIGEEFYWMRPISSEDEKVLEEALRDTYRTFREKMENVAVKMEMVAESISKVLSEHFKNQRCSMEIASNPSILCLRKYDYNDIQANQSENSHAKSLHSHALSLHISDDDHKFWIRSPGSSACFELPAGSMLVTTGRKLQEWSNGEFKSATVEKLFDLSDDPNPSFSLEFMCTPLVLCHEPYHEIKKVSIVDQLLIVLLLFFFYNLWTWISFKFTNT
ncbi:uncharacterized protein [Elaeis guineensis]|uniref:Uncharacterized protein LOC105045961 n=1 Tax=Elaeis guineensis var. tenera TaxID=51953 RepID=A0A6I9R9T5_ELAGV|nr:uncharacterized protein LOC105045961 [Elaeis guineensis]